ncbi:flagellar protein FliT [Dechloromonas sp. A34]|uniref:flagellar protein FliT n=1 Tax=Dechloromonas sp. A34 TaxID=447588 RepID=UPI002249643F|nr:flagellar protein FliT [Dechloromonas sp. A34]
MSLLASYTTLLELSQRMLEQARQQEWESLAATEALRASLLAKLPARLPALSPADSTAVATAIRQIQACDREILEYVTPWREQAATLLSRLTPAR